MKNRFGKRRQFLPNLDNRFPWFLVSTIVFIGATLRALLLYSTTLVPGINGAYYLVQARSLIERGKLGIPDLPLTFTVQAMLAKIVQWISGASLESSIVFAVKCADTILPPLVAIPVFALVRHWSRRTGAGNWVSACAALAVAAGAPALMMVGDFEKNSLALLWLAALLWSLHQWLEQPSFKRGVLPVLFLGLIGIPHIGVFGWALALTVPVIAIALWRSAPETRRAILPWLFVGGGACALAAGLVLWKFDPARITKLANAATHPLSYLQRDQRPGNPPNNGARFGAPGNMPNDFRPRFANDRGNFQRPGFSNRFSGPPGGLSNWNWLPGAALLAASISALAAIWFKRKSLPVGTMAVIGACGLVLFALCGPWVTGDKVMRFRLIAVGPALLCASFALLQLNPPKMRNALAAVMMLALVVPGILHATQGGRPVITTQAADELRSMSSNISAPEKTLIVARHGLEWWAAWYLHTHIAHENAVTAADWKNFDNVYFLHQKTGMQMPGGPMPGQPDRRFRQDGVPDFARAGFPPTGNSNGRSFPPRSFGGGPGSMGEPMIPEDADITHNGEFFTLALAPAPEAFAAKTNATYAQRF